MVTAEERFRQELEVFRIEEESAAQFFYADFGIHSLARENERILALLNTAPLFWRTCTGALQTAAFITLGRIFDQKPTHNLDSLLRLAQQSPEIFSKDALARRKQGASEKRPDWLDDYLKDVYAPSPGDFRRLRTHVRKWRRIYVNNYRDARNKFFAHRYAANANEAAILFDKGTIRELQRLCAFLCSLHDALWQLFYNGKKPLLRPARYSVKRMRDLPSRFNKAAQEQILHEAENFLLLALNNMASGDDN